MSLDVWLSRGRKVTIGGRELILMPLPLSRLVKVGRWLEESCNDVVRDILTDVKANKTIDPLSLVTKVLLKVDLAEASLELFSFPKDLEGNPVNPGLTKAFFEEYLDIPTAHELCKTFVELNQLENLVKNLQSLPIAKEVMESWTHTFGTRFLTFLGQNTASDQKTSGGSPTLRSTDMSGRSITERQEVGKLPSTSTVETKESKEYVPQLRPELLQ